MGEIFDHIQGHISGLLRPRLLPTGHFVAAPGGGGAFEMTWGDGTYVTWGDGTAVEWSNA